jgi:hypothetical protein
MADCHEPAGGAFVFHGEEPQGRRVPTLPVLPEAPQPAIAGMSFAIWLA